MESRKKSLLKSLVEHDPASPEFRSDVRAAFGSAESQPLALPDLWRDVFVEQPMPWRRFLQSALVHVGVIALIWTISLSWIRQQKLLERAEFDRSSLVTYTPEEEKSFVRHHKLQAENPQDKDIQPAKPPALAVSREAISKPQSMPAPDLKLNRDTSLPNLVATGAVVPAVPLDATRLSNRMVAPETQVVAPAPDVQFAQNRVLNAGLKSDVIAPPPEVTQRQTRGFAGPDVAVIAPPPDVTESSKGRRSGLMNIGPSQVVAPAPQLTLSEQHSVASRGHGSLLGGGIQPVGPAPSVSAAGGGRPTGRTIAGIRSVAPTGPAGVPGGSHHGLSSSTQGKLGGSASSDLGGLRSNAQGSGAHTGGSNGTGGDDAREMASLSSSNGPGGPGGGSGARIASPVADENLSEIERQVFRGKRSYEARINMPNFNSSTGSWVMKFAELQSGRKDGDLLTPVLTEKSDPGYPLELMRSNVHGMVTLYAVIGSDGKVGSIRVLDSPDERLDTYAAKALARWKFEPAVRAGKPVALEAVVEIPFRVRRSF